MKFTIFLPDDQRTLGPQRPDGKTNVSLAWIGRGSKQTLGEEEFSDWIDEFKRNPELGNRFYVERVL